MRKAIDDFVEQNGWVVFLLVILLTFVQLVAVAGVAYAHSHYPIVPIALTGDGAETWALSLLVLVVVNLGFVGSVNRLVTSYAVREAKKAVAKDVQQLVNDKEAHATFVAVSGWNEWIVTQLRGIVTAQGVMLSASIVKLLHIRDTEVEKIIK